MIKPLMSWKVIKSSSERKPLCLAPIQRKENSSIKLAKQSVNSRNVINKNKIRKLLFIRKTNTIRTNSSFLRRL